MREINFRCFDKENKKMQDVRKLIFEDGEIYIVPEMYNDLFTTNEFVLMQYTGLKDKNGKEIYEGDVIKTSIDLIGIVKFDTGYYFEWIVDDKISMWNKDIKVWLEWGFEVIGNIYENPELLEVI